MISDHIIYKKYSVWVRAFVFLDRVLLIVLVSHFSFAILVKFNWNGIVLVPKT